MRVLFSIAAITQHKYIRFYILLVFYMFYWPPGVLGICREGLFIYMELGSTGSYFQ